MDVLLLLMQQLLLLVVPVEMRNGAAASSVMVSRLPVRATVNFVLLLPGKMMMLSS
jgi:hypothetical protein